MEACQVMPIKKILAPLDFSTYSSNTFLHAYTQAKRHDAELILISVVEKAQLEGLRRISDTGYSAPFEEMKQNMLDEMARRLNDQYVSLVKDVNVTSLVTTGNVWEEVIKAVKQLDVDLVVMGTGGETRISHLIFGNNAEKVFRHCPCMVLSVRGPEVCALPDFE